MNEKHNSQETDDDGLPSLDRVLRYQQHLNGDAFVRGVMNGAARRRKRRSIVLTVSLAVSTGATIAIMPETFRLPWNIGVGLERIGDIATSFSSGGIMAILFASILLIGASRTIDNI